MPHTRGNELVSHPVSWVDARAAPPNEQGIAMGSLSSLGALMAVIAPLLGTPLPL
jgi:hypothetical protein